MFVRLLKGVTPAIVLLLGWELGARYLFDARFIGQPSEIGIYLWSEIFRAEIWHHTSVTLHEIVWGYVIGAVIGVSLGYVLGFNAGLARIVEPYILIFHSIPKVAIAPIIIIAIGIGIASKIVIVVSMVFFLMFYSVFAAIKQIDTDLINQARIMGASRYQVIAHVVLPAISPSVLSGLKASTVYAVIGAMIGEFIAAQAGLGYYVMMAAGAYNLSGIWVGVIFIVAIVFSFTMVLTMLERRLLRWLPSSKR